MCLECVSQYLYVGVIRCRNDQCIKQIACQQFPIIIKDLRLLVKQRQRQVEAMGMRVSNGGDDGPVKRLDVFDVFTAHAAAADDAVPDSLVH